MSISRIRDSFQNKGCQVVMVVLGSVLMIGFVAGPLFTSMRGGGPPTPEGAVIATLEGTSITASQLKSLETDQRQNIPPQSIDATAEFGIRVSALNSAIQNVILKKIGAERNIKVTQADITSTLRDAAKKQVEQDEQKLMTDGKLKPGASPADMEAAFKAAKGRTPQEQVDFNIATLQKRFDAMSDPDAKSVPFLGSLIIKSIASQTAFSEDDLKKSFDNLVFKVIRLTDSKIPLPKRLEQIQAAQAQLKAGKKFDDVAKAIDPKMSLEPSKLSRGLLEQIPPYKPLLALKPGEVSAVMDETSTPSIYVLEKIEPNIPSDFDQIKANLLQQKRNELANKKLTDDLKARVKLVKFVSPGYEVAFKIAETLYAGGSQANRTKDLTDLAAKAKATPATDIDGKQIASLAWYVAEDDLFNRATKADQAKMLSDRIESMQAALDVTENSALRLQLALTAFNSGKADVGYDALLKAAQNNVDFGQQGYVTQAQITKMIADAESKKQMDAKQRDAIQKELDRWSKDKVAYEKDKSDLKAQQEAESKKLDIETQKAKEEAAKAGKSLPGSSGTKK